MRPGGDVGGPRPFPFAPHRSACGSPIQGFGALGPMGRGPHRGVSIAVQSELVDAVGAATAVLEKVVARLEDTQVPDAAVLHAVVMLRLVHTEQRDLRERNCMEEVDGDWVLNRRWHPAAFAVASSRPRVLLTIGVNALRTLIDEIDRVLQEEGRPEVEQMLLRHRDLVRSAEKSLIDLRRESLLAVAPM
jgi:hypothetical protein